MIDSAQSGAESKSGYVGEKRLDNVPSSGVRGDWARLQGRTWGLQGHAEASEQALLRDKETRGGSQVRDSGSQQTAEQGRASRQASGSQQLAGGLSHGAKEARHRDWPQWVGVPGPQRRALWRAAGGLCDAQEARRRS